MKKLIIVLSILFLGCSRTTNSPLSPQSAGTIKFNSTTYSGLLNQSTFVGVGMFSNPATTTATGYTIAGGNSTIDNLLFTFRVNGVLQTGTVAMITGFNVLGYTKGDSSYVGDETKFTINVTNYSNKVLNGTFTGTLKTVKGTSINITNGQFINVPQLN